MKELSCLELFKSAPPYTVIGDEAHFAIFYEGDRDGRCDMHELEPGCTLGFAHVTTHIWPMRELKGPSVPISPLIINICLRGRCDVTLMDGTFLTVAEHRLVFARCMPRAEFKYPTGHYKGLQFFIHPNLLSAPIHGFRQLAGIDINGFISRYLSERPMYFQYTSQWIETLAEQLWQLRKTDNISKIRLLSALLMHELMGLSQHGARMSLLGKTQLDIVNACRNILCADLSKRITLKALSEKFQINENSLKSYFRQAYGMGITDFMNRQRIEKAKALLSQTPIHIAQISLQVGYENPSKFSAAFKKSIGMTPSEYRKATALVRAQAYYAEAQGDDSIRG